MSKATSVLLDDVEPLDTTTRIITPERVQFRYTVAGPFRRSIAYLIDVVILLFLAIVAYGVSWLIALGQEETANGPWLAIMFFLIWGYGAFCEGLFNGRTVGKKVMGLRVMATQGVPITASQAAIRNLIGAVDGPLPFFYMTSLTSMMLTSRFQRLGDLAAGTMVVIEEAKYNASVARVDEPSVAALLPYLPMRISSGPAMARALSDYVRRRSRFVRNRREEMARHLAAPLRERHALPADASSDAVLCAFYHRLFLGE